MHWIWLIVALLVGLAVGGLIAWTVVKRRYGDRESVVELRTEFDRYKGKVTEHFVETADLVNTLTRNYKRVYDHLEAGAYDLVGEETLRRELDAPAEAPVMIEYLGQRRSDAPPKPEVRTAKTGLGGPSTVPDTSDVEGTAPPPRPASSPKSVAVARESTEVRPETDEADDAVADRIDAEDRTRSAG